MAMPRLTDPYQALGVPRGATGAQIKAAHRRLAKRFHPDTNAGDTIRFLHIQEAYKLLSDPLRRREWDARHAPGPVRANAPVRTATPASGQGSAASGKRKPPAGRTGPTARPPTNGPATQRRPRATSPAAPGSGLDFDVYDRSSGAAWSMAARAYFRRGDQDLPRRGSFRHAGAVPLTAARARVAREEEVARASRPSVGIRRAAATVRPAHRPEAMSRRRSKSGLLGSLIARLRNGTRLGNG
jgi:hypothetical protein